MTIVVEGGIDIGPGIALGGGNLYVCVSTNTWAKFTGTTSW